MTHCDVGIDLQFFYIFKLMKESISEEAFQYVNNKDGGGVVRAS